LIIVGEVVEKYQKQIFQQLHIPTKQRKRYGALLGIIMSLRQQKHMKNFSNSSFGKKGARRDYLRRAPETMKACGKDRTNADYSP
jgi:protoheme ferro-lyase